MINDNNGKNKCTDNNLQQSQKLYDNQPSVMDIEMVNSQL